MESTPETSLSSERRSNWFTLITSPSQFFATRRKRVPWFWTLLIASIVAGITVIINLPYLMKNPTIMKSLSANSAIPQATMEGIMKGSLVVDGFIGPWFYVFVGAVILWLVLKLFGISISYMKTVGILSNAFVITLIGSILTMIVSVSTGTLTTGFLSLHEVIHVTGRFGNLLAALSVFWLWHLYVVTTGVSETSEASRARAFWPVFIIALIGLLLSLLSTQNA